jgi:hypothetical protein
MNSWHARFSFLTKNWMMAAGCIRRDFPWELDGLGNAVLRAIKGKSLMLKNCINSAFWDMRLVVGASQRSVRPMRFGFRLRVTAEIESSFFAYSN